MNISFLRGIGTGCAATAALVAMLWKQQDIPSVMNSDVPVAAKTQQEISNRIGTITSLGSPTSSGVDRLFSNHLLHYSHDKRIPLWVQEHLSRESLKGKHNRQSVKFHSDEAVEPQWRAHNSDYTRSGWSKGHMTPAADNKREEISMFESFALSNIVPQNYDNNSNYWNRLEIYCRDLTERFPNVWVTSGPAFVPHATDDDKKIVSYQVIGANEVAVPTHLYKVIVAEDSGGKRSMGAFLIPNINLPSDPPLTEYKLPLEQLEKRVGFRFYDRLDRDSVADLCSETSCNLMSQLALRQFVYVKQIFRTKDTESLEKLWGKIRNKEVPVTVDMQAAYNTKRQEFGVKSTPAPAA